MIGFIKSIIESLPTAEKEIAEYIINEPEGIIYLSAKELGERRVPVHRLLFAFVND